MVSPLRRKEIMHRRNFLVSVAAGPIAGIAGMAPDYTISAVPEVQCLIGSNKNEIILSCSVNLFANGRPISQGELEIIGRHAELGLCRIKEIVVEPAV